MCCTQLAENTGRKQLPSAHHYTTSLGCIFATKACVDNRKKQVKQQYLLHMSSQYGELQHWKWLRLVGEFGASQQISTGFASWLRYFCDLINSIQQRAPHTFGWMAITLGIGPRSSLAVFTILFDQTGPTNFRAPKWALKMHDLKMTDQIL